MMFTRSEADVALAEHLSQLGGIYFNRDSRVFPLAAWRSLLSETTITEITGIVPY